MTGSELRQQRLAIGMGTAQMAALTGLPEAAVVYYEAQRRIPRTHKRALRRALWSGQRDGALATAPTAACPEEVRFAARGHRDAGAFVAHARRCPTCRARRDHVFAAVGRPPAATWTERLLVTLDALPWPLAAAGQGAVAAMAVASPAAWILVAVAGLMGQPDLLGVAALGMGGAGAAGLAGGLLYGAVRRLVPETFAGAWLASMAVTTAVGIGAYAFLASENEIAAGTEATTRAVAGACVTVAAAGMAWVAWKLEAVRLPWAGGPVVPTWRPYVALASAGLAAGVLGPMMLGILLLVGDGARAGADSDDFAADTDLVTLPSVRERDALATLAALARVDRQAAIRFADDVEPLFGDDRAAVALDTMADPEPAAARQTKLAEVVAALGTDQLGRGDARGALTRFREATRHDPAVAEWWVQRAIAARVLGDDDEVRLAVLAARSLDPALAEDDRVRGLTEGVLLHPPIGGADLEGDSIWMGTGPIP